MCVSEFKNFIGEQVYVTRCMYSMSKPVRAEMLILQKIVIITVVSDISILFFWNSMFVQIKRLLEKIKDLGNLQEIIQVTQKTIMSFKYNTRIPFVFVIHSIPLWLILVIQRKKLLSSSKLVFKFIHVCGFIIYINVYSYLIKYDPDFLFTHYSCKIN